jgi:hypothetical protein
VPTPNHIHFVFVLVGFQARKRSWRKPRSSLIVELPISEDRPGLLRFLVLPQIDDRLLQDVLGHPERHGALALGWALPSGQVDVQALGERLAQIPCLLASVLAQPVEDVGFRRALVALEVELVSEAR